MKKLLQGIIDFRQNLTEDARSLFAKLAIEQIPDVLFIGCSDSRVVPNLFASTNPGDLFVIRNVGNMIPPLADADEENSIPSAIEFSVCVLNVSDIIVCGHSECGAMKALVQGTEKLPYPHLKSWLKYGKSALDKVKKGLILDPALSEHNQLSQINVLEQMQHVSQYPCVRERLKQKKIRVHGWWFDIGHADVYCYEPSLNQFVMIDEKEAKLILERMS